MICWTLIRKVRGVNALKTWEREATRSDFSQQAIMDLVLMSFRSDELLEIGC